MRFLSVALVVVAVGYLMLAGGLTSTFHSMGDVHALPSRTVDW